MSGPPLIDRAVLDDLVDGIGLDGARSVVELFIGESRFSVAAIGEASLPGSGSTARDRARRAAHSLKSGAGQIGAAALAEAAEQVEGAAADNAADLSERVAALRRCAAATNAALARFLAE